MLAKEGLDLGEPLGGELLQPALVQVFVDPVEATLGQGGTIIGSNSLALHGPNGLFFDFRWPKRAFPLLEHLDRVPEGELVAWGKLLGGEPLDLLELVVKR